MTRFAPLHHFLFGHLSMNLLYCLQFIFPLQVANEKANKALLLSNNDIQNKLAEAKRTVSDLEEAKKKMAIEILDSKRQINEYESQLSELKKNKLSLNNQLQDCEKLLDDETRVFSIVVLFH